MKSLASLLAIASIWFFAVIAMGFFARAAFELVLVGWNLWP